MFFHFFYFFGFRNACMSNCTCVSYVFFFLICIFIPPEMHVQEIVHMFLIYFFLYLLRTIKCFVE